MPIIGEIRSFATSSPQVVRLYRRLGWLECEGKPLNQLTYAKLFSVVGLSWGSPDPSNSFRVPDLRGLFLRGVQRIPGKPNGWDPDVCLRTAIYPGGAERGNVGSIQESMYKSHEHVSQSQIYRANGIQNDPAGVAAYYGENPGFVAPLSSSVGGSETRPTNVYVLYMIFAGTPALQHVEPGRLAYPESSEFEASEAEIAAAAFEPVVSPDRDPCETPNAGD